ncbi:MAG: hypothetical protein GY906_26810 [bacterium]|nr:hypothetical protein [bacterium]
MARYTREFEQEDAEVAEKEPGERLENLPSGGYAIADDFRVRSVEWAWLWIETSSAVAMHGKRDGRTARSAARAWLWFLVPKTASV